MPPKIDIFPEVGEQIADKILELILIEEYGAEKTKSALKLTAITENSNIKYSSLLLQKNTRDRLIGTINDQFRNSNLKGALDSKLNHGIDVGKFKELKESIIEQTANDIIKSDCISHKNNDGKISVSFDSKKENENSCIKKSFDNIDDSLDRPARKKGSHMRRKGSHASHEGKRRRSIELTRLP